MTKPETHPFSNTFSDWQPPTPVLIHKMKALTRVSTEELSRFFGIKSHRLRHMISTRYYIKGNRFPFTMWRLWLEYYGVLPPLVLSPRAKQSTLQLPEHTLQPVSNGYQAPTPDEFKHFVYWTGLTLAEIEDLFGLIISETKQLMTDATLTLSQFEHLSSKLFSSRDWQAPTFNQLNLIADICSLNLINSWQQLGLSPFRIDLGLTTTSRLRWKNEPLPVSRKQWLTFLANQEVHNPAQLKNLGKSRLLIRTIKYPTWRRMVLSFNLSNWQ